jgi:hypothetical protein
MSKQFQYKHTPFLTEPEMNAAGALGWELVAVLYGDNAISMANLGSKVVLYWKREVQVGPDGLADPLPPTVPSVGRPFDTTLR